MLPDGYFRLQNGKISNRATKHCISFPRLGAFEITYSGKLIHSKLAKGNWPLKEYILSFIAKEIENFFLGKPNLSGNYG